MGRSSVRPMKWTMSALCTMPAFRPASPALTHRGKVLPGVRPHPSPSGSAAVPSLPGLYHRRSRSGSRPPRRHRLEAGLSWHSERHPGSSVFVRTHRPRFQPGATCQRGRLPGPHPASPVRPSGGKSAWLTFRCSGRALLARTLAVLHPPPARPAPIPRSAWAAPAAKLTR